MCLCLYMLMSVDGAWETNNHTARTARAIVVDFVGGWDERVAVGGGGGSGGNCDV